jgi:hypothetical protein
MSKKSPEQIELIHKLTGQLVRIDCALEKCMPGADAAIIITHGDDTEEAEVNFTLATGALKTERAAVIADLAYLGVEV